MDKDLLCAESGAEYMIAEKDNVILDDNRVLDHLLESEIIYMPQKECLKKNDLDPDTRKIVAKWMLEVCEEEGCLGPVLPLAINLFDRFLCKCSVPMNFLQLIAADCLLIASKMRQNLPISINTLCFYTDHSISPCQLRNFETLIVTKLKWDLAAVTSFDFVDQILQRIDWCSNRQKKILRTHSITLLNICCTDIKFFDCKPSMIAAGSIICAMRGIQIRTDSDRLSFVCSVVKANVDEVKNICSQIERIVSEEVSRLDAQPVSKIAEKENTCYEEITKKHEIKKPETPVDVQNVKF